MNPTYPALPIVLIAVSEVQRRHAHELAEVLNAARAVSDLPADVPMSLDVALGVWVERPVES